MVRRYLSLRPARTLRMTPNRTGRHVDYLEIYEGGLLSAAGMDTAIWRLADRLSADRPVGDVRTGLCNTGLHTARDLARDMLHPMSKDRARVRGKPASESCGCCPQPRN